MAAMQSDEYGYDALEFPSEDPEVGWKNRVTIADHFGDGFAYRPLDVLTNQPDAVMDIASSRWGDSDIALDERQAGPVPG